MFSPDMFINVPSTGLFAPAATKEFPMVTATNKTQLHNNFQPTFDKNNQMRVSNNPYSFRRFIDYYNNPEKYNPADPKIRILQFLTDNSMIIMAADFTDNR